MLDYTLEQIEAIRDVRYHRTPALRVETEDAARRFVDNVGFCFLFGDRTVEIPTLWGAVCGVRRSVPKHHHDADLGRTWSWKDSLPSRREIYYGKLLRSKPTLVSLDLLPAFYALSPNYGDIQDYVIEYEEGRLTTEAKQVYEALLNGGALATSRLRQVAGLSGGGSNARRFDRALGELQSQLRIVKVGISDANRWGYAYVYDLFLRRFPDVPSAARAISTDEAMDALFEHYVRNVVAVPETMAKRLFRWNDWEWERLMARLAGKGSIQRSVEIEGIRGSCLVSAEATTT